MEEPSQKTEVIASSWFYLGEQESEQARKEFLENRRILTIRAAQGGSPSKFSCPEALGNKSDKHKERDSFVELVRE